ncbi:hypothetical protein FACS1894177_05360 [Bacteroidia bacterium]|nr:hypothetical protein FACS1894177_05360 [Bacteroidia bacterium]
MKHNYTGFSSNNETITDKGMVKLSLPFGDINSTPVVTTDNPKAMQIDLISINGDHNRKQLIISVDRKNTAVPIMVLFAVNILDLYFLPKMQAKESLIAKIIRGKTKNISFRRYRDIK